MSRHCGFEEPRGHRYGVQNGGWGEVGGVYTASPRPSARMSSDAGRLRRRGRVDLDDVALVLRTKTRQVGQRDGDGRLVHGAVVRVERVGGETGRRTTLAWGLGATLLHGAPGDQRVSPYPYSSPLLYKSRSYLASSSSSVLDLYRGVFNDSDV